MQNEQTVVAINAKWQKQVNKVVRLNALYDSVVNENYRIEGEQGILPRANARRQELWYDRLCEALDELPKRERLNVSKTWEQ